MQLGNQPPVLDPVGNQTVALGNTLTLTLTASDPETDPLSFTATPLPLPENATLSAPTGVFTFTPQANQVGVITLTFVVSDGLGTDSETITITVPAPDPAGVTSFTGRLLDANDFDLGVTTPIVGATITFLGTGSSAISDTQGNFTITAAPSGSQTLDIDASTANLAPDGSSYAGFREETELIAAVNNVIDRPFFLPRIAAGSLTTVNPNFFTTVTNPDLGVSLRVPPNTAKNPDGSNFTGDLSISLVPRDLAPVALPDTLDPGLLITIQPVGVTFSTPVPITFPNTDNLPPGSQLNIWSLDPDLGVFSVVGTGLVSADGTQVETISGGIRAADWHFLAALAALLGGIVPGGPGPIQGSSKEASCQCSSTVALQSGSIETDFSLPTYRSVGVSRGLRFVYNTGWASPRPVIPFNSTIGVTTAVPQTLSYKLAVGGVDQGTEIFLSTTGLQQNKDETLRSAVSFDGSIFTTAYTIRSTNNYLTSRVSADLDGQTLLRNETESAFGVGWALEGVERIFTNFDGSLSVVTSDNELVLFTPQEAAPPFVNFDPPAGNFSTLVKNPTGTFTRTLKDGTQINFDTAGRQTSQVDRNGNTTSFGYDAGGRLTSITDPAGLITILAYTGGLLSSVTDPAGKVTSFTHDFAGNLTQVTFPDTATRIFAYDERHLMISETNERGLTAQRQYDSLGRFVTGTRADGSSASATNIQAVGFVDPASGVGTQALPAPVTRPEDAENTLTDGKGNTTSFETDSFGATTRQVDALTQVTLIERDENGNPTRITRPNSAVVTMTYDALGNLLTSTDAVGATTTFTYDPTFNQVTSILDPKGNTTTINYDLSGNPIEIIDALTNRTQMAYDARGLLTSLIAAVGTPEANTTTFTYDVRGNLVTTTDPLLNTTTLEYDLAGNVIKSTDAETRVTEFAYDPMNRLLSVLDAALNTTQYVYDARGNLTTVTDAKTQTTTFAYDAQDRLTSAINPLALTETFTYDANGNLTSTTNRNSQILTFDYDVLNRLTQKTLPPSASQIGSQITTFSYDSVGNLTQVTNPATTVTMQYDLANRLVSSTSSTEDTLVSVVTLISQATLIDENNQEFEGKTLQVDGTTLTVDGTHTFANLVLLNGAVLTHSPTTATTVKKLDLTITGTLQVDATSRIDAVARGFLGGNRTGNPFGGSGMTVGFAAGSTGNAGGSYGGSGGAAGTPNPVYGDFRDPSDPGSGGAATLGQQGGTGGGLIRIVAETLSLDGVITAGGGGPAGTCCAAGGSGGSIRIDVATLTGTGEIIANGAGAFGRAPGGGGGGGRVAVFYQDITGFNVAKITALGALGSAAPNGGAGTVYLEGPGRETGELIIDNNNLAVVAESTPIPSDPTGILSLTNLRIRRAARVRIEDEISLTNTLEVSSGTELPLLQRVIAATIDVTTNSVITHPPADASAFFKVDLNAGTVTVDATSRIDVTAGGFLGGNRTGNPFGNSGMTLGFVAGSAGASG
ncbi:cadherin-like domain-containing protein, partial [Acidobacteria bacterium AH-259-L09]|nr:cadherin-like domain-containing protein [Acidobacteria bacterium AH-259-L09]